MYRRGTHRIPAKEPFFSPRPCRFVASRNRASQHIEIFSPNKHGLPTHPLPGIGLTQCHRIARKEARHSDPRTTGQKTRRRTREKIYRSIERRRADCLRAWNTFVRAVTHLQKHHGDAIRDPEVRNLVQANAQLESEAELCNEPIETSPQPVVSKAVLWSIRVMQSSRVRPNNRNKNNEFFAGRNRNSTIRNTARTSPVLKETTFHAKNN